MVKKMSQRQVVMYLENKMDSNEKSIISREPRQKLVEKQQTLLRKKKKVIELRYEV